MIWWHDGMGWGGWTVMVVIMGAFWALVIFSLMTAFRRPGDDQPQARTRSPGPEEILRERFARGEIDTDEYHARQTALRARE